jgi:hypothetical protein
MLPKYHLALPAECVAIPSGNEIRFVLCHGAGRPGGLRQHVPCHYVVPFTDSPLTLQDITITARKYAKAMHAPLIFCSASHGINVLKLFKLVFEKVFSIDPAIEKKSEVGDPIFEY